eukprot:12285757-Prorocentrum_lima.AAC.1
MPVMRAEVFQYHLESLLVKSLFTNCNAEGISLWRTRKALNSLNYQHGSKLLNIHAWFGLTATCVLQV